MYSLFQVSSLIVIAEARREIHAWLGHQFPNDIYENSIQTRLDGTCNWILDHSTFLNWVSPDTLGDANRILWINGPAGFGKTILCAKVVEHLTSMLQTPVVKFFLSSDFESRDDPFTAIRSWISQTISIDETAFHLVYDIWLTQHEQIATRRSIMRIFREIVQVVPGCVFVMDGLDECTWIGRTRNDQESISGFLEAVRQVVAETTARIMIVSRDEADIRRSIADIEGCSELRINIEDVRSDAKLYSRSIVDRELFKKDEATKNDISQRMADRCNGQFLWLKLQGDSLENWMNKTKLEKLVDETPQGLEHIYKRNWTRIEQLPQTERKRAFSLLRWTAFALRPLNICEITEAVLIDEDCDDLPVDEIPDFIDEIDDEYINKKILRPCGSLLEVRDTQSVLLAGLKTVHLAHFSVKQYFLCNPPKQGYLLVVNENIRSTNEVFEYSELAKLCLLYINYPRVWEHSLYERRLVQTSFRKYAAGSWIQHAQAGRRNDLALFELMKPLFDLCNPNWESWSRWYDSNYEERETEGINNISTSPLYYAV
jgi:hypothetical protein